MLEVITILAISAAVSYWLARGLARKLINLIPAPNIGVNQLSISEVAYLCGGEKHLYPTWWMGLRQRGLITPSDETGYFTVQSSQSHDDDLNRVAYLFTIMPQNEKPALRMKKALKRQSAELEERMISRGILARENEFSKFLLAACSIGLAVIFLGMGLIFFFQAYSLMGLFWGIAAGLMTVAYHIGKRHVRHEGGVILTDAGITLEEKVKQQYSGITRAPKDENLILAVAVGGTAVLLGTPFYSWANEMSGITPHVARESGVSSGGEGGDGGLMALGPGIQSDDSTQPTNQILATDFTSGGYMDAASGFSTGGSDGSGGDSSGGSDGGSSGCGGGGCGGCGG